ncbi:MAG: DNA-binding protein [Candidatus Helarchaeota archaeon]|nr:DNA-binding protein [Candidatus Helarchaeota archaeon]
MDDEELEEIRRRKMAQIQGQVQDAQRQQEMQEEVNAQKQAIMRKILSPEARQRLTNIAMVRPEFAAQLEMQLIQLAQSGQLARLGTLPLSDENFKSILTRLSGKKQDFTIKHI